MEAGTSPGPLLGPSESMRRVRDFLAKAADVDVPVLLVGETGTGKSHLARLIHSRGRRREGPFVGLNCAGIPDGLFESELFGHERGAFTGAVAFRAGLFELADGGTLFLDEIGELPAGQQAKLLTALEDGAVRRVGGSRPLPVDVRIVAATSRDLAAAVEEGVFRADVYHRIGLLRLVVPPLRERPDDVELLAGRFLGLLGRKYGRRLSLHPEALALLLGHPWPGNVRELSHALEAAVILSGERVLRPEHLARVLAPAPATATWSAAEAPAPSSRPEAPADGDGAGERARYSFLGSDDEEREAIRRTLVLCRGNRTRTARKLGMSRNTLRVKLRKYGLSGPAPGVGGSGS